MNPDDSAHGTLDEPASKSASTPKSLASSKKAIPKSAARPSKRRVMKLKPVRAELDQEVEAVGGPSGSSEPSESAETSAAAAESGVGDGAGSSQVSSQDRGALPGESDAASLIDPDIIARAEGILKHTFEDRSLLARALTHASIAPTRHQSNERLEFLGDAVLGMIVCEYLYANYPDLLEGDMTKIKSDAVSRKKCAKLAAKLDLDELLLIGKGMQTRSSLPSSLSAAVVESLLGALYVEAGIERVRAFLLPLIGPMIDEIAESGHHQNFKSVLQQHAQQVLGVQPVYHLLEEKGPDHDKAFYVAVELGPKRYEACWSRSKKQAEQAAAERTLIALGVLVASENGGHLRPQTELDAPSVGDSEDESESGSDDQDE